MPTVTYVHPDGTNTELEVAPGKRVMQSAIAAGIDGIVAECGGQAMCATCHVYVDPGFADVLPTMSDEEDEMLEDTASPRTEDSRLSCQLVLTEELDGLVVRLPESQV